MKSRWAVLLFYIAIIAAVAFGGIGPTMAQNFGPLNGTWEGDLKIVDLTGKDQTSATIWRRIIIQDKQARVFYRNGENKLVEVKQTKFRVERHLTNALVFSIDSDRDDEGLWVETWVFAVTQKDNNTLITNFYRVVNNNNLPLTVDHSKFSQAQIGELQRKE